MTERPFPWHALHQAVADHDALRFARVVRAQPHRWTIRDPWGRTVWMIALAHGLHDALPHLFDTTLRQEHLRQKDLNGRSLWHYLLWFPSPKLETPEWARRLFDAWKTPQGVWSQDALRDGGQRGAWNSWLQLADWPSPPSPPSRAWVQLLTQGVQPSDWWAGAPVAETFWRIKFAHTRWRPMTGTALGWQSSPELTVWRAYWQPLLTTDKALASWCAAVTAQGPWAQGWVGAHAWLSDTERNGRPESMAFHRVARTVCQGREAVEYTAELDQALQAALVTVPAWPPLWQERLQQLQARWRSQALGGVMGLTQGAGGRARL